MKTQIVIDDAMETMDLRRYHDKRSESDGITMTLAVATDGVNMMFSSTNGRRAAAVAAKDCDDPHGKSSTMTTRSPMTSITHVSNAKCGSSSSLGRGHLEQRHVDAAQGIVSSRSTEPSRLQPVPAADCVQAMREASAQVMESGRR